MDPRHVDLSDVEKINSLDTARMTLRWALERLRALELSNADMEKRLTEAERDREGLRKDGESVRAALDGRVREAQERELYYRRMEELLSAYCRGQLDVGELARRQAELDSIKAETAELQVGLEKEYAGRRLALEEEQRKLAAGLQAKAETEAKALREQSEQARRLWEKDIVGREGSLRTREARLAAREKALDQRQAMLESDVLERRKNLDEEFSRMRMRLEEEHSLRREGLEQERSAREQALERAWRAEEAALREKAAAWEDRAREYLGRVLELEGRLISDQTESLARLDGLDESFRKAAQGLSMRRQALDHELGLREHSLESERRESARALSEWRARMEEVLKERFAELERETGERQERWAGHERELKDREREAGESRHRRSQELEQKSRAVEELRARLLETIQEYKDRMQKRQGG